MTPGPARGLTRGEIVDAGLTLLARGGSAALSLRGVASAVQVAPAALYTYFPSKQALMRGMVERVLGTIELPDPDTGKSSARRRLLAAATAAYGALAAQPGMALLIMTGPLDGPHALRLNEHLLQAFADTGLSRRDAARASYVLQVYVLGSIALTSAGTEATSTHVTAPPVDAAADFPRTAAASDVAADHDSPEQFAWGLRRVIDGLLSDRAMKL